MHFFLNKGKQLKLYAKSLKALALRIKAGHTSTITTTIESTFFELPTQSASASGSSASSKKPGSANSAPAPPTNNNSFQSTFIPTMSTINLDKSIYEELKQPSNAAPVKQEPNTITSQLVSNTPSLSNILTTTLGGSGSDLLAGTHSPLDFSGSHGQPNMGAQAQILNFSGNDSAANSSSSSMMGVNSFGADSSQAGGGQHGGTQPSAREQHHQSLMSLNFNLNSPPCLFLYMIDPFEFNLYNSLTRMSSLSTEMDLEPEFAADASQL